MDLKNHPCFNDKVRHLFARVHLPVAPKCNVQCNFCNRKFDCVNESRPGVSSAVLSPGQALAYLEKMMEKMPNISVVGIAGPGDPFANPDETMETLRRVRERYPEMLLCVATNGLNLFPYLDDLKALNVSHVTVTVNAVDPKIGAQIYSWIRDGKRLYRGEEGARLLLEIQKGSIQGLIKREITTKINSIIIPGINDFHIEEVAKEMAFLKADILNAIPLYKNIGTVFEHIDEPTKEEIHEIRRKISVHIPQMHHCTRCRADAAGILGKDDPESVNLIQAFAALPLNPKEKRPFVAVGTMEGLLINRHLGEAVEFWIFEKTENGFGLVEKRKAPAPGSGNQRWEELARIFKDCRSALVGGVGKTPKEILERNGIKVFETEGFINDALELVYSGKESRLNIKATTCGLSCSGTGTGCG